MLLASQVIQKVGMGRNVAFNYVADAKCMNEEESSFRLYATQSAWMKKNRAFGYVWDTKCSNEEHMSFWLKISSEKYC